VKINIGNLCPWDLTLTLGGVDWATTPPAWKDVIALEGIENMLKAGAGAAGGQGANEIEPRLREAIGVFFAPQAKPALDALRYDDLLAAFTALSAYFGDWLKKKQQAAQAAALGRAVASGSPALQPAPGR
jgi:hypothetical protein